MPGTTIGQHFDIPDEAWSEMMGACARHPAVLAVYLFGSSARGTRRPFSDVDLCIISSRHLSRAEKEDLFSHAAPGFDISFFENLPLNIRYRIFREGKVLFCRDELQLQRVQGATVSRYLDFSHLLRRCCARVLGERDV